MVTTIKNYGTMYGYPFLIEYNKRDSATPYCVRLYRNGHYFATEREAFQYAEGQIDIYFEKHPKRKYLR